jgi:riboflavin kinase/FMN adenylyltransferase
MSDLEEKLSALELGRSAAITVGTFDGVHRGHHRLLRSLISEAADAAHASIVVTFEEQPRALIDPTSKVTYLATFEYRTQLISEVGPDALLRVCFDQALRKLSAAEFLAMLKRSADVRLLIVGPGATLGHDRMGAESLLPVAEQHGIRVVQVDAERRTDGIEGDISSSAIRRSLAAGEVEAAASMLGRRYRVEGKVVPGDRRGRELGFPTANIEPTGSLAVPMDGIYATVINADGKRRMAATSIGVRPTFESDGARIIEAYILDFDGDIYGQDVQLEFVKRLRGEMKFDGAETLINQMNRDVSEAREVLTGAV